MKSYYDLLLLHPRAAAPEVEAAFRRVIARYRPTLSVEHLLTDPRFIERVNAYLTLSSPLRVGYDRELQRQHAYTTRAPATEAPVNPQPPTPFAAYSSRERQLFQARIASWRREPLEAIHLLRALLQHEPDFAPAWAALGEVYFIVDRLEEGIQAVQRAVQYDPENQTYSARLAHALAAEDGKVRLKVELSAEEALLHAERLRRWHIAIGILLIGMAVIIHALLSPGIRDLSALYVPWRIVTELALAMFCLCLGAGYGRLLQPFEQVMLWSSLPVLHRGGMRTYPYGLLLFITAVPSLWLCVATLLVMAMMDEEWPISPSIMLGACTLLTVLLTYLVYHTTGAQHWSGTFLLGGNMLIIAAMLGWWAGSINVREFD